MRPIQSLHLQNFRGYVGDHTLDLDADLVLITGKNGSGKTSLLLAIDLLLNGRTTLIESSGILHSKGKEEGFVGIVGPQPLHQDLFKPTELRAYANLLERAQFFFPEGLATPENSQDVLSIVAPTANTWEAIRLALSEAQTELAEIKSSILVKEFDVERERRALAQRFVAAQNGFSFDSAHSNLSASIILESRSLLIQNGNLANHWQSQLRNLLEKLEDVAGLPQTSLSEAAETLDSIAKVCDDLRARAESAEKSKGSLPTVFQSLQRALHGLPRQRELDWTRLLQPEASHEVAASQLLSEKLSQKQRALADTRELRRQIDTDENGLVPSLEILAGRSGSWVACLQTLPDSMRSGNAELETWLRESLSLGPALVMQAQGIAEKLRQSELELLTDIAGVEAQVGELRNQQLLREAISPFVNNDWVTSASTVGELLDRGEKQFVDDHQLRDAHDREIRAFNDLSVAARAWANMEREIERQAALPGNSASKGEAEKIISEAERTLKRALGKDSVFSLTTAIDEKQLRELTKTLNRLLARFHFPPDFLPIELQVVSKNTKVPTYRFASARGPDYAGLSTGQKTQLAVCWSVCLSYSLCDLLTHRVLAFDDFTTALDMGQLIPAAGILRQLAYCSSADARRQVIVTSHHEDLTNRLLDYLLPPQGCSMKVIEFVEWTPDGGPEWEMYDVKPGGPRGSGTELGSWLNAQLSGRPT